MFDNMGNMTEGGMSRILEVDLNGLKTVWEYTGTEEQPFVSKYSSMIFPLANGNILAAESLSGRIIEVNRNKEVVWKYLSPGRHVAEERVFIPHASVGGKFSAEDLGFIE